MARQNRVTPTGEILASPARGLFMGNRGCLHDADGRLGRARWRHKAWVCCVLSFKGRRRTIMAPGRYTELFFLDEAVALAAGHRPCAECRRADYRRFRAAFGGDLKAGEIDIALHAARARPRQATLRQHEAPAADLPDGAFLRDPETGEPLLIWKDAALRYRPGGYDAKRPRPTGAVRVLTPPPTLDALAAGYAPVLHPTAAAFLG